MIKTILAALFSLAFSVTAQAYCSAPTAPYCATSFSSFNDRDEFDRCKREMESYQSELESFVTCEKRELSSAIEEAQSEMQSKVDDAQREMQSKAEEAQSDAQRKVSSANSDYSSAVDSFNRRAGK
ncbi:hypothetical protein [Phyllobacterium meliloti]|uniref:hypothetical protein n=1 Tax=Phyllobacterium meliloti TaxID=555317 RepID=UPI001D155F52|nr:hypothetical protein [Phyllobacterium sp. T1293]UGX87109.1 hypothetical protein LLE53_004480 [Phyllobacterium sp. T1293]